MVPNVILPLLNEVFANRHNQPKKAGKCQSVTSVIKVRGVKARESSRKVDKERRQERAYKGEVNDVRAHEYYNDSGFIFLYHRHFTIRPPALISSLT